jgi:putative OPT family oligopeptide transporter
MTDHKPYVPPEQTIPEFTLGAVLVGAVLGIIFGASSLYLVLKVGMTVSASIPVAVLSITLFRWLGSAFGWRNRTILENNITQTTGSAGESIAFGVGVTMPALMLIGFEMEFERVMVVSVLGGLLGILMMIPLRRAFIVQLHGKAGEPGKLLYPEGTACAQVLISGDRGGSGGGAVFIGFGIAFIHKFVTEGMNLLSASASLPLKLGADATDAFSRVARLSTEMASELLGVGYIIGMRTASIMMAGAVLGGLVIVPTVAITASPSLTAGDIARDYLRYIGAGCVAAAGIISMVRTLPMIVRSFSSGVGSLRGGGGEVNRRIRTEDDLPPKFVFGGGILLLGLLSAFLLQEVALRYALMGALLVMVFGFLFVTVSSRLTGEIGSSSNPISGMTVATLLMTCLIFLGLDWVSPRDAVLALSIGGVVCIAASNGGTTSQDLKTGFLVGATPRLQQWAILIGAFTSAIVIGGTLIIFNQAGTIFSQRNLPNVNLKEMLPSLTEKTTPPSLEGSFLSAMDAAEVLHVFRPNRPTELQSADDPAKTVMIKPGKYLVDANGWIRFRVDPTITGELTEQDHFEPVPQKELRKVLTAEQLKQLPDTVTLSNADDPKNLKRLRLWKNDKEFAERSKTPFSPDVPPGEYVVDDEGRIVAQNKPRPVRMKFTAPKTQVMGIIINGLLGKNLNWSLILIGACLSVALELCGVSSLAFAVGVYIPMQYSTPIFLGGVVRWIVDRTMAQKAAASIAAAPDEASKAEAEVRAIAESESSPGMLLSSGFIAGGSLAGVLLAFLNFPLFSPVQKALDFAQPIAQVFHSTPETPSGVQQFIAVGVFGGLAMTLVLFGIGALSPKKQEF